MITWPAGERAKKKRLLVNSLTFLNKNTLKVLSGFDREVVGKVAQRSIHKCRAGMVNPILCKKTFSLAVCNHSKKPLLERQECMRLQVVDSCQDLILSVVFTRCDTHR